MFCRNCGEVLIETDVTCQKCGFAAGTGFNYCEHCGSPAPVGGVVCEICGGALPQSPFQQPIQQPMSPPYSQNPQVGGYMQPQAGYPPYPNVNMPLQTASPKSKVAAGVFGILFGCLGVHNFYLGYNAKGVVQLLLTLCSCGALSFISGIWGLVEGILILSGGIGTDGKGLPLKE